MTETRTTIVNAAGAHESTITDITASYTCGWRWTARSREGAEAQRVNHLKWQGLGYKSAKGAL